MATFTDARRALILNIEQHPYFKKTLKRRYYFDHFLTEQQPINGASAPTSPADLPAIRVRPAAGRFEWSFTNQNGTVPYTLEVTFWHDINRLDLAEDCQREFFRACYPDGTNVKDHIRAIRCKQLEFPTYRVAYATVANPQQSADNYAGVIVSTMSVTIPIKLNPRS